MVRKAVGYPCGLLEMGREEGAAAAGVCPELQHRKGLMWRRGGEGRSEEHLGWHGQRVP